MFILDLITYLTSPGVLVGIIIGLSIGLPVGWLSRWQYNSYKVKNFKVNGHAFLLTPRKNKDLNKQVFTYVSLILFVISLILYWIIGLDIPLILQLVFGGAAGSALGINLVEPIVEKLLRLPTNSNNYDPKTKPNS